MSATAARRPMPKRKDTEKRDDVPVRVDADVIRDARIVAASRAMSLAEYLSDLIRPVVARDLNELQQDLARRSKPPRPPGAKGKGEGR